MEYGQLAIGAVLTAIGAVLVSVIKAWFDGRTAKSKIDSEVNLAADAQEFNQQVLIIANQGKRIVDLERANEQCVKDRDELYKQGNELYKQLGHLEGRLDEQQVVMQYLRKTSTEQSQDAVKLAGEVAAKGVETAAQLVETAAKIHQKNGD